MLPISKKYFYVYAIYAWQLGRPRPSMTTEPLVWESWALDAISEQMPTRDVEPAKEKTGFCANNFKAKSWKTTIQTNIVYNVKNRLQPAFMRFPLRGFQTKRQTMPRRMSFSWPFCTCICVEGWPKNIFGTVCSVDIWTTNGTWTMIKNNDKVTRKWKTSLMQVASNEKGCGLLRVARLPQFQ